MRAFVLLSLVFAGIGCSHCAKAPAPAPVPDMSFSVEGKSISVQGKLKPGAKISVPHAKTAVGLAVGVLEK